MNRKCRSCYGLLKLQKGQLIWLKTVLYTLWNAVISLIDALMMFPLVCYFPLFCVCLSHHVVLSLDWSTSHSNLCQMNVKILVTGSHLLWSVTLNYFSLYFVFLLVFSLRYPKMLMLLLKYRNLFNLFVSLVQMCLCNQWMSCIFNILKWKSKFDLIFRFLSLSVNIQNFSQRYWRIALPWSPRLVFKNSFLSRLSSTSSPTTLRFFLEKYILTNLHCYLQSSYRLK